MQTSTHQTREIGLICLVLAVVTFVLYWPVHAHEFINYDDNAYITENVHVLNGLNWAAIKWAFTTGHTGYAHPVTWLSHQLDYQLFHSWAGGHHLTSVVIHIFNTVLLLVLFWRMTGAIWPSAFVAAVFAIHPLHVESVAWIAERKDVLSGFFWMLTLHAYVAYTASQKVSRYLLALLFFALGLMCKPMIVTLPCVLLLLDYWPLGRATLETTGTTPRRFATLGWLIVEKVPFTAMAAIWSVVTFLVTKHLGILVQQPDLGIARRTANALVSYSSYFCNTFWPHDLALFYPYPKAWPTSAVVAATILLILISVACIILRRSSPYLIVGWLWFLGILVPVIGLIQAGLQARADRYTYMPQIGLSFAVTFFLWEHAAAWRYRRRIILPIGVLLIIGMICATRRQIPYWRNSETTWRRTLSVTAESEVAHDHLGSALGQQNRLGEAVAHLTRALEINPNYADSQDNLAVALAKTGRLDEAITHYEKALAIKPDSPVTHYNLAAAFLRQGHLNEALPHYQKALELKPDYAEAHNNLGNVLLQKGYFDQAIDHYRRAMDIRHRYAEAQNNLAIALQLKGRSGEATPHQQDALRNAMLQYEDATKNRPGTVDAHNTLATALFQNGRVSEAVELWKKGLSIQPQNADLRNNLAVALLQTGSPKEAIEHWQEILRFQPSNSDARISIAWVLATSPDASIRNGPEAIHLIDEAKNLSGTNTPVALRTLAAALAEDGRFAEAADTAEKGARAAREQNNTELANNLEKEVKLYRSNFAFRDESHPAKP